MGKTSNDCASLTSSSPCGTSTTVAACAWPSTLISSSRFRAHVSLPVQGYLSGFLLGPCTSDAEIWNHPGGKPFVLFLTVVERSG